jgi:two-component system, OmpR family, sensor histidine kinase BaeS
MVFQKSKLKRSLSFKLILSFLVVNLIAIGLAAGFIWNRTSSEFNRFVLDQNQYAYFEVVSAFYEANDSWKNVDKALLEERLIPPPQSENLENAPAPPFVLVDQEGKVIVQGKGYRLGEIVNASELEKGFPIVSGDEIVGTVLATGQIPVRTSIEQEYVDGFIQALLIGAAGGVVIALALGYLLARSLTKPTRELTRAVKQMEQGKLDQQVEIYSQDEMGDLAHAFNLMSTELARSNANRRQMTAEIAHDLRNPLTVINGYIESMLAGVLEPTNERMGIVYDEVQHMRHLVEDLRTLSLADSGAIILEKQSVDMFQFLENLTKVYAQLASSKEITLRVDCVKELPKVQIDVDRIGQAMGNLINNAMRHTQTEGSVVLAAKQVDDALIVSVQDDGEGIDAGTLPLIFDRFHRGDSSRHEDRSGLGLPIAKSLVELHGGKVYAESEGVGKGALFSIQLPMSGA